MKVKMKKIISSILTVFTLLTCSTAVKTEKIEWDSDNVTIKMNYDLNTVSISGSIPFQKNASIALIVFNPNFNASNLNNASYTYSEVVNYQNQIKTDNDGKFDFSYTMDGTVGIYNVMMTVNPYGISCQKSFKYADSAKISLLIKNINEAKSLGSAELMQNAIDECFDKISIDCRHYEAFIEEGKNLQDFYDNMTADSKVSIIQDIEKQIEKAIMLVRINTAAADEIEGLFKEYADELLLNGTEVYKTYVEKCNEDVKKAVGTYFSAKKLTVNDDVKNLFAENVITETVNDAVLRLSWGDLKNVLTANAVELDINLTKYNRLKYPDEVYKSMLKKTYSSISDITKAFYAAVDNEYTNENSSGGNGSGGGGSAGVTSGGSVFTLGTPGASGSETNTEPTASRVFSDMKGYEWAQDAAERLLLMGVVSGREAGIFDPSAAITREEFVKMLSVAAGLDGDTGDDVKFIDVDSNMWYYRYIKSMVNKGLVEGLGDNQFGIGKNISREDVAALVYRVIKYKKLYSEIEIESDFADFNMVSDYAKEAVNFLQKASLISGMGDGTFRPKDNVNRAQAAVIINNLINYIR